MKHTSIRKPLSVLLSILMVLSVFGGMAFPAGAESKTIAEGVIYKLGDTIVLPGDGVYYVKDSERHPAQEIYGNGTITEFEGDEYSYSLMIDEWGIYARLETFDYEAEINQGLSVLGITFTGSGTQSDPYLPKLAFGVFESTWAGEGEGTEDSPWLIKDLNDLRTLSANVADGMMYTGKYLKLAADIDCGSENWAPIGTFGGTFDGNGKTVSYQINGSEAEENGLFAEISKVGTVKNLNVSGSIVSSADFNGGVAGKNCGSIINCFSTVDITTSETFNGGIAGGNWFEDAKISYCAASGTLTWTGASQSYSYTGGITGENRWGVIDHCTSFCNVLAENAQESWAYVGILDGRDYGTPTDCYYLDPATTAGLVNFDGAEEKTADELKVIGQAAYDAGYTVYGLALGAVASNPDQESVETLELTQHEGYFAGKCFSVAPGSMTDLYDYNNSWNFDGDDSLSEMGVTISALYGEAIRKVVVYARSHWNSFWNGTPVAVAGDTTLTYTRDGNTFTFENVEASSVIIGASSGTGLMISKIDVYYADTDHDVVKTVRLIDAIGTVAYTTACKQKIDAAKAAYEALTDEQKEHVSNYETLQLAEGQYAALQLAADMTAFEAYKTAKKSAMDALLQEGDSEAVQSIVGLAKTQIEGFTYDESKTLDENKAALDTLVANVPNAVAEQRAADAQLAADKAAFEAYKAEKKAAVEAMAEEGDSTDAQQIIADAAAAIEALTYDEAKTLDENKTAVDAAADIADALAAQRAADLYAAKDEFNHYKAEQKAAVEAMAQEGDSEAVAQIIAEAAAAIDALIYDEFYTLAENKATVDTLANIADRLAAQRAADAAAAQLAADKAAFDDYKADQKAAVEAMAQEGDSEAAAQIIADAAAAIEALTYDEAKTLDENKAAVDALADIADRLAAQRAADAAAAQLAADKAAFDDYKAEAKTAVQDLTQAGDSEAAAQIIADAAAAIEALTYDEAKTLDENKAAVDALADIADALAAQRAADETPDEPATPTSKARPCPICGKNHGYDLFGTLTANLHHFLAFIKNITSDIFGFNK